MNMRTMGRFLRILAFAVVVGAMGAGAQPWDCGATPGTVTATLSANGTRLVITGTGAMADNLGVRGKAWSSFRSDIKEILIGQGVTSIGYGAFSEFTELRDVSLPTSMTSIGFSAFQYCERLPSVTIPNGVTSIGGMAFNSCKGLSSVTIPGSVTSIGESAFADCPRLWNITIPEGVTIGENAFNGCGLYTVTIPNSVTYIGRAAFGSCDLLLSIEVGSGNTVYSSVNGVLFNKAQDTLLQCPGGRVSWSNSEYSVPNGVTSIGDLAFSRTGLTSVTIPNSVTSIGKYAFSHTGLTSVTIPNSVTSIEYGAFSGCVRLQSVTLPNRLTTIETSVFQRCSSLTSVTIPASVTSIGMFAFSYLPTSASVTCLALSPPQYVNSFTDMPWTSVSLYVPQASIAAYRAADGWKDFGNILPTTVTVTFNSQSGSAVASQEVGNGGKVTKPADPTRANNIFDGWYKEAACTNPWNFSTDIVTSNTTLYAKWKLRDPQKPVISTHPSSGTVTTGTARSLTVTASVSDGGVISYQWYKSDGASASGTLISGATGATYAAPTGTAGTFYYYVVVTNTITGNPTTASVTSNTATLTVNDRVNAAAPVISTQPAGATVTVSAGSTRQLTVAAGVSDGGVLSYQWYSNTTASNVGGTAISGATGAAYTASTATAGTFHYYVAVTNTITNNGDGGIKAATVTSNVATLTVNAIVNAAAPAITTQPASGAVSVGTTRNLTVTAVSSDGGTLSYQWYKSEGTGGTAISGATGATYAAPIGVVGTFYYYVTVTNTIANNSDGGIKSAATTSSIATLTVNALVNAQSPVIATHPLGASVTVSVGSAHQLAVVASVSDGGALSYQWYRSASGSGTGGVLIAGAVGAAYSAPIGEVGTYYYYVAVTNTISDNGDGGIKSVTVTSGAATLVVEAIVNALAPEITAQPQGGVVTTGTARNLTVLAVSQDGGALSYQWYSSASASGAGGAAISGAVGAAYAAPISVVGTYYYYVVVTNAIPNNNDGGVKSVAVTSEVAALTVNEMVNAQIPYITAQPLGFESTVAQMVTRPLSVEASVSDGGALGYQWYSNTSASNVGGTAILGATGAAYAASIGSVGTFHYYVVVSNVIGDNGDGGVKSASVASDAITVTVNAVINAVAPYIYTQPQGGTVTLAAAGTARSLTVGAVGDGVLSYQWYRGESGSGYSGLAIPGETNASYAAPIDMLGTFYYYVVVTNTIPNNNDGGIKSVTVMSDIAELVVNSMVNAQIPYIYTQPQGGLVRVGEAGAVYLLTVAASVSGGGTLAYQWYAGGEAIGGATGASYIAPIDEAGTFYYYVTVTNAIPDNGDGGSKSAVATSDIVTLKVESPDAVLSHGRVIPAGNTGEVAVVAPVNQLTAVFSVGPNPVGRSSGGVTFFWRGKAIKGGSLTIYGASGSVVRRVTVKDDAVIGSAGKRAVGSWDLRDSRGRPVGEGTYLARGKITVSGGKSERVSVVVGVK